MTPQEPQKRKLGILIGSIVSGVLLAAAATITVIVLVSGQNAEESRAAPTTSPTQKSAPSPKPTPTPTPKSEPTTPANPGSGDPVYGPDDPEIGGTGDIGERLELFKTQMKKANDDGTLWEKIPKTKENVGAYLAMQFMLTDMRSAARFGISPETAIHYAKHAKHLEIQLLAQKPLGSSLHYTMQDGTIFDYDGDTGAVKATKPE